MNPAIHRTFAIEAQCTVSASATGTPDLFNLDFTYGSDGEICRFYKIHIPQSLQSALLRGDAEGIDVEALEADGFASSSYPGELEWLIISFRTHSGETLFEVPRDLQPASSSRLAFSTASCALGVFAWNCRPYAWPGAIARVHGGQWLAPPTTGPQVSRAALSERPANNGYAR